MDEHEYTKHYYIEGERVCSKIGGGFGPAPVLPTSTPLNFIVGDETDCSENLFALTKRFVLCTGYSGNWEISHTLQPAYNTEHDFEDKQYFYHPDHLGSSSFITNALGRAEQHLQYLPFGELWINQRNTEFDSPYKFSAKELDSESGYNYFGARYYDSEASIWLSVDPMADEYLSTSPYMYVMGRPTRLIDPNGMNAWIPPTEEGGAWTAEKGDGAWDLYTHPDNTASWDDIKGAVRDLNKNRGENEEFMVHPDDELFLSSTGSQMSDNTNIQINYLGYDRTSTVYEYNNPESTLVTLVSSPATTASKFGIKATRLNNSIIDIHWGMDKAKYAGWIRGLGLLGTTGDLISLGGAINNIAKTGWTANNVVNLVITGIGFIPVYGDIGVILYTGKQFNIDFMEKRGLDPYSTPINDFKCFAEGSQVIMGDFTRKNIEDIIIGDSVLTYNLETDRFEKNVVQQIETPIHHKLVEVSFKNGEVVISTEDHPYYVKGKGWCSLNPELTQRSYDLETKKLQISDFCFLIKKNKLKKVKVTNLRLFEDSIKTYNLSKIENSNNYFVNGILVHNESK
jgi:RHS repeat-associated protein